MLLEILTMLIDTVSLMSINQLDYVEKFNFGKYQFYKKKKKNHKMKVIRINVNSNQRYFYTPIRNFQRIVET